MKNLRLTELLPYEVISVLRSFYVKNTQEAQKSFNYHRADEDSLTGALGQKLILENPIKMKHNDITYDISAYYAKIRGRGPGAPEKIYGTDGVFRIVIRNENGEIIFIKHLYFQAKKEWHTKDSSLAPQALALSLAFSPLEENKKTIFLNFSHNAYEACYSYDVIAYEGDYKDLKTDGKIEDLGNILAFDFINCEAGFYESNYNEETGEFSIISLPNTELFPEYTHEQTTEIIIKNNKNLIYR